MPEIRVHLSSSVDPIKVHITLDDHVSLVLNKIAVAANIPPNLLYVWVKEKVQKTPIMLINFITQVFAGNSLIEASSFVKQCAYYFDLSGGNTAAASEFNMITKSMAYKTLLKMNITHVVKPVTHFYMSSGYILYLPYDPYQVQEGDNPINQIAYAAMQNNGNLVIDNIIDSGAQYQIYAATLSDIPPALHEVYFPFKDSKTNFTNIKKFIGYLHDIEQEFQAIQTKPFITKHYLNIMHLKSIKLSRLTTYRIDLAQVFEAFKTSKDVPFVKYKGARNIYHKVSTEFLAQTSGIVKDFENWYSSTLQTQDHSYLVFKIHLDDSVFASLIINDNMEIDVRMAFSMKAEKQLESTGKYFKKINNIITSIHSILQEDTMHILPISLSSHQHVWDVYRLVTYHVANLGFKANKENAERFVVNKLFSYFDVIPDAHYLRLQYKKVSNYNKAEQIAAFIQRNHKVEEATLVERISANFSISPEDAQRELENWQLYHNEDVGFVKYDNYVEVNIQFNSPIDVKYIISGASSYSMIERICHLVSCILAASERKAAASKDGTKMKDIFLQEIEQPQRSPVRSDIGDDDDDWAAELRELEADYAAEPPEPNRVPENSLLALGDEKKLKGFVKRMLDHADPALFSYKSESKKRGDYASICGWVDRRQPVVITEAEKRVIDEKYPGAYNGYVKTGSTVDLERRHYYICPKVWCPSSRVAIPPGAQCPGENETPIVFESKTYWGLGDQAMTRDHYPGFLDKYTRADGLCLPCCFKLQPKEGNRNKKRQEQCVPLTEQETTAQEEDAAIGTEKYIKADTYFPLEVGRYGLLTKKLHSFLGKPHAGSRHNGTGLMTEKTETYLRKGIAHGNQSFINCIVTTLDNPKIKSANDFIKLVKKKIDIFTFLTLENGKILQLFIDHQKSPYNNDDFTTFRSWFMANKAYIQHFNLLRLQKELDAHTVFSTAIRYYKDVLREFIIYYSFQNFVEYVTNNKHEKDHRILLDLINISTEWLNVREYNYIVINIDVMTGDVHIDCPMNRDTHQFVNKFRPFVVLIKQNKYYEPMYYVKNLPSDQLETEFKFPAGKTGKHDKMHELIMFYFNNCSNYIHKDQDNIALFLESHGYKPKYYVIDYDFRMCGLLLQNNLFVPFAQKKDSFGVKGLRFVYISDVILFKCLDDIKEIKRIFRLLAREYGADSYDIHAIIKGGQGIVLTSGKFIPLNVSSTTSVAQEYLDELYIFTGIKESDERTEFIASITKKEQDISRLLKNVADLDEETKLEITFLRDRNNPMPLEFKRAKLMHLLAKQLTATEGVNMVEVADKVLNYFFEVQQRRVKRFHVGPNELLFDYQDIQEGRLSDIIERARNPYKLITNKLDNLFDKYVFDESVGDDNSPVAQLIPADSVFEEMPVKYGNIPYRKLLKGYMVLGAAVVDIVNLFISIKRVLGSERITRGDVQGIINTNIKKEYVQKSGKLQEFYDNPSFKSHMKAMKLKVDNLTLDNVLDIINTPHYKPSFAEIRILARVANVNVIIIGRKTLKNPDGLFEVVYVKSSHYLFVVHSFDRKEGADRYQLVVKDKEKVLLGKNDLPAELVEMINDHLEKKRE